MLRATNTQLVFYVGTTWKRLFPSFFNVDYTCVFIGRKVLQFPEKKLTVNRFMRNIEKLRNIL